MRKILKIIAGLALGFGILLIAVPFLQHATLPVLQPRGVIASHQLNLIITVTLLMLIVVIPVFAMTVWIAWRYRASNTKAKYTPDWDHHALAEFTWWALPCLIILIIGVITWQSSHDLDPYKPLESNTKPLTVQVVALQWKWLFIYPEQHIATVNYLQIPTNTPINFQITADAPMNSFWIPQLGGQVYAMSGMQTQLHLMASRVGDYQGSSANLSGQGFAGMKFTAHASTAAAFQTWTKSIQQAAPPLTSATYTALAKPSENNAPATYSLGTPDTPEDLFNSIIMRYMDMTPSTPPAGTQ